MGKLRLIEYEGSDDQILKLLTQGLGPVTQARAEDKQITTATTNAEVMGSSPLWDDVARKFHKILSATAAYGRRGQLNAMTTWLRHGREVELTKLWKAAGVKTQHDYSGVGGSLTKNMLKAGGPREWYEYHQNANGEWIYGIIGELFEPLKRAFGVS